MNTPKLLRITDSRITDTLLRNYEIGRLEPMSNCKTCSSSIWFSAFFDGTGNNFKQDGNGETNPDDSNYSNIAKIYKFAHASQNLNSSKVSSSYIEGVGTPCPRINDSGQGWEKTFGMAAGHMGKKRIDLMMDDLNKHVNKHMPYVTNINIAIFGFSRGATQARAFARMLGEVNTIEHSGGRLFWKQVNREGNRPQVNIYFMGLLDTVASVNVVGRGTEIETDDSFKLPLSLPMPLAAAFIPVALADGVRHHVDKDGHAGWAKDLRIPRYVEKCVHLIAGHEVRRLFPLDSVREDQEMPANCIEECYPGTHSDIGGGYSRAEQEGRTNELGNITLARLYIEAWKAGVPLKSADEIMNSSAAGLFHISAELEKTWTDYMSMVEPADKLETHIISHMNGYYQWRAERMKRRRDGLLDEATIDPYMEITDQEWKADISNITVKQSKWITFKLHAHAQAIYDAYHARHWQKHPEEKQRNFRRFFDHYVHDSIAGFKQQMTENNAGFAEMSRWSINRKVFIGKRQQSYLYWRYEGWTPATEAAKIAILQQHPQTGAVLAQHSVQRAGSATV